ncbi:microtubule organization protein AKNA [Pelmatolapia mariae]|uniref:microtubule organization protein AKNA n=1 Tax=Pelmatolapia mariae TaxID=158779 RepID=UPI002FE6ADD6
MEGDLGESDEDVQGEDRPVVLWEKCIEQSFFVDLSEDESLHLSDLESSLALHLSQAESAASEASIHLSGDAELSGLDDSSSESSVGSQSRRVLESSSKRNLLHVSSQRSNTMQDKQGSEDTGQNTSDEDQEDLPYDGNIGSPYFNKKDSSEGNISSDGGHTVHTSPDLSGQLELVQEDMSTKQDNIFDASKQSELGGPHPGAADINQLLLRHFSQEELLRLGRLIEAETLPEVSLLESADDSVFSRAPTHNSKAVNNNHTESSNEKSNAASKKTSSEEQIEKKTPTFTSGAYANSMSNSESTDSKQSRGDFSADEVKQDKADEEEEQVQRVPLVRTRSFSEMRYGQGQVHYPLPDFSKVAPKVKIPKTPARSLPQCPSTIHRAQSSPGMLEVISRVLEDSVLPAGKANVFKDEEKHTPPALVHHLQAEYDKLLTKYAEAENLIDQMRLGTSNQPSSELMLYLEDDDEDQGQLAELSHLGYKAPHLPSSESLNEKAESALVSTIKEAAAASSSELQDNPSDGERMTTELRDIICQFMQKVDEFRFTVSNMAVSAEEKQMMLRSMMEAQDQLERKYISKKEEHRALEMQNYIGLSRNTGTFDANRLVEGDIFRIGMHLEDIKEIIDKNVCDQISPPHSTSTPTSTTVPTPVCMFTPSPPPSLHEGQSYKMDTEEEEAEGGSDLQINGGSDQSSELVTADPLVKNSGHGSCQSRDSTGSLVGLDVCEAEEEERSSGLSEVADHSDILAYLCGNKITSHELWTVSSHSIKDRVSRQKDECDLGDCVSLAVEVSCSSDAPRGSESHSLSELDLNTSCASQKMVSSETDSGFGSSYLNHSGSGSFQSNLLPERCLSSSDSEDSCSHLQTAIHSAITGYQWASPHPSVLTQHCGATAAVDLWVDSTTKKPSAMLQGSDQSLSAQLVSQPLVGTSMDTDGRGSPLRSCSCNSEAILALQSEVSRLKKDLEVGLVQLPHLAQKMDYLTSKYRQERQERRSRTRTYQSPACNSQARLEDWISSDMDPSQSKGTDSSETSTEIMLQLHSSPAGSRKGGRGVSSGPEFQFKRQQAIQPKVSPAAWTEGGHSLETSGLKSCRLKGENDMMSDFRPQIVTNSLYSKDRWSLLSSSFLQKPLLQVSYGSSCSLPASYKFREPPLQSMSHLRKRSTQSDTALLPSDVYFQRTPSPSSVPFKTGSRTSRRSRSKEEDVNRTLDRAIEMARSMKRTTDRMARRLSADLAKAQLHRKLHHMQSQGGRKHQDTGYG